MSLHTLSGVLDTIGTLSTEIELNTQVEIDETVEKCRTAAARLQTLAISLLRQRNTLAPISKLPNELLIEVFDHYISSASPRSQWPDPWLLITHVCSRWRAVAIDCPKLWSTVVMALRGKSQLLAMLFGMRSGEHLLDIDTLDPERQGEGATMLRWHHFFFKFVVSRLHRVRSLQSSWLSHDNAHTHEDLLDDAKLAFPALEVLDLYLERRERDYSLLAFPPKALPRLKKLRCTNAPYSFVGELAGFTKLTTLTVEYPLRRLSGQKWLEVFRACPALEIVVLLEVFGTVMLLDNSTTADMPALNTLHITEKQSEQALLDVFGRCKIPPTAQVQLTVTYQDPYDFFFSLYAIASGGSPSGYTLPPIVSCHLDHEKCSLYASAAYAPQDQLTTPRATWVLVFPPHDARPDDTLPADAFLSTFALPHLAKLTLGGPFFTSDAFFKEVLSPDGWQSLPDAPELCLESSEELATFLELACSEGAEFLPALHTLTLDCVDFSRRADSHSPLWWLQKALRARERAIPCLRFVNCTLFGWDPMVLVEKRIVGRVEVI